jgi:hypothetical protein
MNQNSQLISRTMTGATRTSSQSRTLRKGEKINVGSLTKANVQVGDKALTITLSNGQKVSIPHFGKKCTQSLYLSDPKKANVAQDTIAVGLSITDKGLNLYQPDKSCGKIESYDRMVTIELSGDGKSYTFESKPSNSKFVYFTSLGEYGIGFSSSNKAKETTEPKDSFSRKK